MNRKKAMGIVDNVRRRNREKLAGCVNGDFGGIKVILLLDRAQNELTDACAEFEEGDACEKFDDLYVMLFDALSFITTARRSSPIALHLVQLAIDSLDRPFTQAAAVGVIHGSA